MGRHAWWWWWPYPDLSLLGILVLDSEIDSQLTHFSSCVWLLHVTRTERKRPMQLVPKQGKRRKRIQLFHLKPRQISLARGLRVQRYNSSLIWNLAHIAPAGNLVLLAVLRQCSGELPRTANGDAEASEVQRLACALVLVVLYLRHTALYYAQIP